MYYWHFTAVTYCFRGYLYAFALAVRVEIRTSCLRNL